MKGETALSLAQTQSKKDMSEDEYITKTQNYAEIIKLLE